MVNKTIEDGLRPYALGENLEPCASERVWD